MQMERPNQYSFILFFSTIIADGLVYFTLCLAAEFKKSKKNDLRLDGKFCYLPRSSAFELGIAALILLSTTQVIANLFICRNLHCRRACKVIKPSLSCSFLVFSWISFGLAVILISAATSMSQAQPIGEGWLDGDCYLVKNGVFVGSALLGLLALGSTLGSAAGVIRQWQTEENRKILVQIDQ
ncbi:hypothetical protein CDL12_14833 [Handroanthus impetiginosus]|uniref:Uncharacterized protein n=1 Tax=Handroanthus impetiginosus TaxID=429701 RepID=A0A2G9H4W1_9LAMI|nr:hypothetical protein CDL12_14833 [Handroanthus impetiginosus]